MLDAGGGPLGGPVGEWLSRVGVGLVWFGSGVLFGLVVPPLPPQELSFLVFTPTMSATQQTLACQATCCAMNGCNCTGNDALLAEHKHKAKHSIVS